MTTTAITEPKAKVGKLTLHTETVQQLAGPSSNERAAERYTPSGYTCLCPLLEATDPLAEAVPAAAQPPTVTDRFDFTVPNGAAPESALVLATDERLYGTASGGGAAGPGTVFSITTSGLLTTLHSLTG